MIFPQLPPLSVENVDERKLQLGPALDVATMISMLQSNFPGK